MEFIEGKWYKTSAGSFVKYSHTDSDGTFRTSEDIMYGTESHKIVDGKFGPASRIENFTEADLTEIEPYLPEGHPDKKFVLPECWFIQLTEENQEDVIKWHKALPRGFGDVYDIHSYYGIQNNGESDAWTNGHLPENSIVITYNQFKKYVLNQPEENYSYLDKLLSKWNIK